MKTFLLIRPFMVFSFIVLFIAVGNKDIPFVFSAYALTQLSSNLSLPPQLSQNISTNTIAPILKAETGIPDYEPPINVFLILHIDPLGELGQEIFKVDAGMYRRTYDEIDWLMTEAARHDLHFSSLYNGWYPKWASEHDDLT